MNDIGRTTGSIDEFDLEWSQVIQESDADKLIYPSLDAGKQFAFFEGIKSAQVFDILARNNIQQGDILEVGCGAAGISLYLAERGFKAHLCDISKNALQVAGKNRAAHFPQVEVPTASVADARSLPYPGGVFDVVMSYGLLEHFEPAPLQALLVETLRVLKPGGLWIADVVPGLKRINVRTLGTIASFAGSSFVKLIRLRFSEVHTLYVQYFQHYFESSYSAGEWGRILGAHPLSHVQVQVCRPFPPLAFSGRAEAAYTRFLRATRRFHQWFDRQDNAFTRRWGWMYLIVGRKDG